MPITYETHRTTTVKRGPGRPRKLVASPSESPSPEHVLAREGMEAMVDILFTGVKALDLVGELHGMNFVVGFIPKDAYDSLMRRYYKT